MDQNPLDELLEKLASGDAQAAEQVFLTYEPYLRMVVRRQLSARQRVKFDSSDVVQSIWADLWGKFQSGGYRFADAAHLRAFLLRATRNRFIDRIRQTEQSLHREQALSSEAAEVDPPSPQPRPSQEVQAKDLWEELLGLCAPGHREILVLKREGKTLAEIAEHTGLHPSSIRRILYELAREYGARQLVDPSADLEQHDI